MLSPIKLNSNWQSCILTLSRERRKSRHHGTTSSRYLGITISGIQITAYLCNNRTTIAARYISVLLYCYSTAAVQGHEGGVPCPGGNLHCNISNVFRVSFHTASLCQYGDGDVEQGSADANVYQAYYRHYNRLLA